MREPHNERHFSEEVELVKEPLWKSEQCHSTQHIIVDSVPVEAINDVVSPSSITIFKPFRAIKDWIKAP